MKRSKKVLSLLMAFAMLISLLPAVAPTAEAAQTGNWDGLRAALGDNTTRSIKLTEDFKGESVDEDSSYSESYTKPFETIQVYGNKTIDLSGHTIYYKDKSPLTVEFLPEDAFQNDYLSLESINTMFQIMPGAVLTINDSSKKGEGKIQFDSHGHDNEYEDLAKGLHSRDVFHVEEGGKLIINGGTIESGSTHKHWLINAEEIKPIVLDEETGRVKASFMEHVAEYYIYFYIYNGNGRFDGNARYLVWGSPVHVASGGELVVNGGEIIGRGSGLQNDSFTTKSVIGSFWFDRDEVIHVEEGAKVHINGGSFTGLGGADIFGGAGANGTNVTVRAGQFEVDKHDHVFTQSFDGMRTTTSVEGPFTQISMVGSYGSAEIPGIDTSRTARASFEVKKNWDDSTCVTMNDYTFKSTAERKLTVDNVSRDKLSWDGISNVVVKDPYQRYFLDHATIDGYEFQYKWYIYKDSAMKALETIITKNVDVGSEVSGQNQLNLKAQDIDWTKSDTWTIVCEAVERGPDGSVIAASKPLKLSIVPPLAFDDQTPAMDEGETTAWMEVKVAPGEMVNYSFRAKDVPEGYTVDKYIRMEGQMPGLMTTKEVKQTNELESTPVGLPSFSFEKPGWYKLTEVLTLKNSKGEEVSTLTNTFNIYASEVAAVVPVITQQPKDVYGKAQGDSVTLTAAAKDAARAKWYRMDTNGSVTALTTTFTDGVAAATQYAGSYAGAVYYCVFWSADNKIAQTDQVSICVAPSVTNGASVTVSPGGTAFLRVTATGCDHYAVENGWYAPGSSAEVSGTRYAAMGTTLAIENVTAADAGTYTYKYVTRHGEVKTGTVQLTVGAPAAAAYLDTFEIYMDEPVFGKAAPTTAEVPADAEYRVKSVNWTGGVSNGIVTFPTGVAQVTLEATGSKKFKGNSTGALTGYVNGISKTVYSVSAEKSELTVTIDYNDHSSSKVIMPVPDSVSVTTDKLSFVNGQEYKVSDNKKITGTFTCGHDDLAENYQHVGMTYTLESTTAGNAMPAGLTLNKDGSITGKPTAPGTYTVVILAHSANSSGTASNGSGHVVKAVTMEVTDGHAHSFAKVSTTATCTQDGTATYKCSCGLETTAPEGALSHDWGSWTVTDPATCTDNGEQQRVCKRDNSHVDTAIILAKDHTAGSWQKDAGKHWKTCTASDCGIVIQETVGMHVYSGDLTCDTCGYKHTHSYTTGDYEGNLEKHWQVCTDANCPDVSGSIRGAEAHQVNATTGTCSVCGALIGEAVVPTNPFTDVPAGAYYEDAVLWALENNITTGLTDTTFGPDKSCTRAQAVTFLWRAAGSPVPASTDMPFTDVASGAYYYNAVLWAVEKGITNGTSATTFGPDATCVRGQIVTFLWRSQGQPAVDGSNPFTDVADSAYYYDAVLWAVKEGVTSGTSSTTFSPNSNCTRAQIVTFLYRCMGQ